MRNHNQWRFRGHLILAIQAISLLVFTSTSPSFLHAKQPDPSANEILDYHRHGKNVPVVSIDQAVSVESVSEKSKPKEKAIRSDDFLTQGPLSPVDDAKEQVTNAIKTQEIPKPQSKRYDSGSTFGSNLDLFLAGPLSKADGAEIGLGKDNHSIKRENRGDPKTTFDQSENRYHSQKQVQKDQENNPPDDTTVEEDTTTETPEQTPQITLDLTGWTIGSQGSSHTDYSVTYLNGGTGEQAIVIYDLTTGTVKSVTLQTTVTTTTTPDLSSLEYQWSFTKEDGTTVELYKTGQDSAILYYDANGNLIKAVVTTVEEISLDSVTIPPYFTELYGWTSGWGY